MKQKGFIFLPIVVLLGLFAFCLVVYKYYQNKQESVLPIPAKTSFPTTTQPQPITGSSDYSTVTDHEGALTYTNRKYGYSVSFKPDSETTLTSCGEKFRTFGDEFFVIHQKDDSGSDCSTVDNIYWPLGGWVSKGNVANPTDIEKEQGYWGFDKFTNKDIVLGGLNAKLFEVITKPAGESGYIYDFKEVRVYNPKTNMTYTIALFNSVDHFYPQINFEEYFNQVVSSFKFID